MNRADYEASICRRMHLGKLVPFRSVSALDWDPQVGCCHDNVDKWVQAWPEMVAVRGWVTFASYGSAIGVTAHSVVRDESGELFDITPLHNEGLRQGMRFIEHVGDEQLFCDMRKGAGISFICPDDER